MSHDERRLQHFHAKLVVNEHTGCHEWTAALNRDGYGIFRAGHRMMLAHRFAYEQATGQALPSTIYVLHQCDNPRCCNPAHLTAGTQAENHRQMRLRGRRAYAFTAEQVWWMRVEHFRGGVPLQTLVRLTGRPAETVSNAVQGRTYAHVPHPRDYATDFTPRFSDDGRRVLDSSQGERGTRSSS